MVDQSSLAPTGAAQRRTRRSSPSSISGVVTGRWNPTKEQIEMLEELYSSGVRTPSAPQIEEITVKLKTYGHIEGKNVFYWFQNHKARQRQKQKQQVAMINQMNSSSSSTNVGNYHSHPQHLLPIQPRPVHQVVPSHHHAAYTPTLYHAGGQHQHHQQHHHPLQIPRFYQSPYTYNTPAPHNYYITSNVDNDTQIPRRKKRHNNDDTTLLHQRPPPLATCGIINDDQLYSSHSRVENHAKVLDLFPLHPTAEGRCSGSTLGSSSSNEDDDNNNQARDGSYGRSSTSTIDYGSGGSCGGRGQQQQQQHQQHYLGFIDFFSGCFSSTTAVSPTRLSSNH